MLRLVLFLIGLVLALPAVAQDQATLISDSLEITGDTRLIADGNVEVFFKGRRLKAQRIVFDRCSNCWGYSSRLRAINLGGNPVLCAP